jgi:hypothetical protein
MAGVARIAAAGATAISMQTRYGRDAILTAFTEMEVGLSRAALLKADAPAGESPQ